MTILWPPFVGWMFFCSLLFRILSRTRVWTVRDGIIYLRFDNPELDCNIRDYSLSPDYFEGYMDGVYSSTWFTLRNYERYWNDYGYWSAGYSYRNGADVRSDSVQVYKKIPKCVRTVNVDSLMQVSK